MDKYQKIVRPLRKGGATGALDYQCTKTHYKDGWCKLHHPGLIAEKEAENERVMREHEERMKRKGKCGSCKYWESTDCAPLADGEGRCRRYPPKLDLSRVEELQLSQSDYCAASGLSYLDYRFWNYPVVEECGWCGEWCKSI